MPSILRPLLATLAALNLAVPGHLPAQPPAKHGMTLDDLQKLVRVGDPKLSPDGRWIAYTVSSVDTAEDKNVTQLWMISWDGSQDIQLTFDKEGASDPRWSPDGKYLAFTSGREGTAKGSQVWLLDRRGGEAQQLTNVKQDLNSFRWSPDSKHLLLTLQEKVEPEDDKADKSAKPKPPKPIVVDRYHFKQDVDGYLTSKRQALFLFDLSTKALAKLTSTAVNTYDEDAAEYSPDGKLVAFTSNQSKPDPDRVDNSDLFVVSATANSAPRQLTTFAGPDEGPLAWTSDSATILFRESLVPHYSIYNLPQLASIPAGGGSPKLLSPALDQWTGAPIPTFDGKAILTSVSADRSQYLAELPVQGGPVKRLTPEAGTVEAYDQAAGHVALLWTTDLLAPELYAFESGRLRKLTSHNDALLASLALEPAQDLSAKASDGNEVHSLLTVPPALSPGTKVPLLLRIHGGPTSQDTHSFSPERQLFAARGYAVLNVNYRGSTGRGHAYSEAINADWGNKEVLDLLASVDAAIASGPVDPDKLGIGGWSYGGILTDYTIASSTRFKAASSGAGMGNLLGLYGVDQYIQQYENEFGPPWKNLDPYLKLSYPLLHADRIKTPTLFMGGENDFNVPLVGGEQMYQALKSTGIPAELIVYPGAFHGFTRPSYNKDRYQRWFAWYDLYIKGITPPAPPAAATSPATKPAL